MRCLGTCFLLLILVSCSQSSSIGRNQIKPDEVIRRHIQFLNEKNIEAAESYIVKDRRKQINWQLDDQKNIRIISLTEELNPDVAKSYMETGRGSITHPAQLKIYLVELEKEYNGSMNQLGKDNNKWFYFVVKQTEDSPWLIDDWGI